MLKSLDFLSREERLAITLKALYKNYGFKEFALSSFDEYSLYADNQSFIGGKDVISFSVGGKLLALRPDVTLSIIKNGRFGGQTQKLFYDEKVYRKTARGGFSEVSQIGAEVIGDIDIAAEAELCVLMLKTLSAVGGQFVLDLSHMGITLKILESLNLGSGEREYALECLRSKNSHDFVKFAQEKGLDKTIAGAFANLITTSARGAKKQLEEINKIININEEIKEIESIIKAAGGSNINIDFSISGDLDYYNGLIFKGYIKGIPHAVLSGGRYDKLLQKFGKSEKALGFALYLGELCKYSEDKPSQPEAVLIYNENCALSAFKRAEELRAQGINLAMCKTVPEQFNGKIFYAENKDD